MRARRTDGGKQGLEAMALLATVGTFLQRKNKFLGVKFNIKY